ncbi:MAG: two-component regulator propeller domain-containing protein [Prolixibacteraceae bacterium]
MCRTILRVVFFLFISVLSIDSFGQQPNLEFSTLNALENVTNSRTTSIIQDSRGFLWIGTHDGLFRFDGQTVYSYYNDANDSLSLAANKINKLFADHKNNLWICTSDGLCRYNPEYDNFIPIITNQDLKGVPGTDIYVIAEDKNANTFIAFEKTIYKLDSAKNGFVKIIEVKQGKINSLVFDNLNNIWIAASADGGLFYYDQQKKELTTFRNEGKNNQTISNNEIVDVALIAGKLWIAAYGSGIDCYSLENKTFRNYHSQNYFENFPINFFVDRKNKLWVSTLGSLKLYDPVSDDFFNYYHDAYNPKSLGKSLTGFYEDHQGNYWTIHSLGAIKYTEVENKFSHFNTSTEGFWNTSEKNITSISNDEAGNLWIGNYYNGIDVFYWQEHRIDRYFHNYNDPKSVGNGTIFSIFRDSKNQMWVGSNLGGLQKFNPATKNFDTYQNLPHDTLSIAGNDVRSITEDQDGNIWVTIQGKGVDCFNQKNKTFKHYNARNNRLSNDYTFQILSDKQGNIWVGSAFGLNKLPKGESLFQNFISSKTDSGTVSNNIIQSIYQDQNQDIWIGTPTGLDRFNPQNNSFTRYSQYFWNKNVCSILSDRQNNIWISTSSGLAKLNPATKQVSNFTQNDGLISREYFPASCYTSDHQELYFGGSEGIDVFNPDSINVDLNPPKVWLTDVKLFNKSINYKTNPEIIDKSIDFAKKIILGYHSNSFTLFYNAIKLTRAEKITYAYKLDGFEEDWNYVGGKKEANYNNMKPGNYTFRVKARTDNGDWSENDTSIQIQIIPAWWMTIWFKSFLFIFLIAAPFVFIRLRTKQLRNQREKLELLVAERTIEISNKNDQLISQAISLELKNGQLKELNSTKDKLFSIISHDLRSPFSSMLGFQDMLVNHYNDFGESERQNMLGHLYTTTNQVFWLVENLLNWARIQTHSIKYQPVEFKVRKVVLEKLALYQNTSKLKEINFKELIPDELIAFADINMVQTILRNLINNAVKFTDSGGSVTISAQQEKQMIKVSVSDTGIGMNTIQMESLFQLEKTKSRQGTNGEMGSGLGLILCKEFVEQNHGTIKVESTIGIGTTISFTLPAGKQA